MVKLGQDVLQVYDSLQNIAGHSVESALASDASSGQKEVEVSSGDGSEFSVGGRVQIIERSGDQVKEFNTIDSISTDTLTMTNNLSNTYEAADDAYVETKVYYKRFKDRVSDPDTGVTKTWYEQVTFTPIMGQISSYTAANNANLKTNDKTLIFRQDEFTKQPSESDEPEPKPGDEININGNTWTPDLDDTVLWREDTMQKLFEVYIRRRA